MPDTDLWYGTSGPRDAKIVICGESWGEAEAAAKQPFVGASGNELNRMLAEAGIDRNDVFCTNMVAARPERNETCRFFMPHSRGNESLRGLAPSPLVKSELIRLSAQLQAINPKLVIATGNYPLWAMTDCTSTSSIVLDGTPYRIPGGITSWRGSMWMTTALTSQQYPLLPLIHPAAILREWELRNVTVHDLKTRVPLALRGDWRNPVKPTILAPPSFVDAFSYFSYLALKLNEGEVWLVHDIETARGCITCMGFGDRPNFALVLPLVRLNLAFGFESYWPEDKERVLLNMVRFILRHPNVRIIGQNYIFDTQYMQQQLGVTPNLAYDTMLAQHTLLPGTPKGLDYLSSLFCKYHWYWKDDGKEWDTKGSLEQHLAYNGEDIIRTWEVFENQRPLLERADLASQYAEQLEFQRLAVKMMNRGVKIDTGKRAQLAMELACAAEEYEHWFERIIPDKHVKEVVELKSKNVKPWYRSSNQQRAYFSWLGLKLPLNRKTKRETFGKEALTELKTKHPEYIRLFNAIEDYRSIGVFHSTFISAPLEPKNRMRCSYNVAGTETYRWSSSQNPFGRGTNLQNIPSGDED